MCALTYLNENDRLSNGHETIQPAEDIVFRVIVGAVNEHLRDALDREFRPLEDKAVAAGSKFLRIIMDLGREGGGKEEDLNVSG